MMHLIMKFDNRIAICISGEPRYWHRSSNSIEVIRNECQANNVGVDIFYHLWDSVTKRQSNLLDNHILEEINKEDIVNAFAPTVGVFTNKDFLDKHINIAWEYIQQIEKKYNLEVINRDNFIQYVKFTNNPPFSQLVSMCESLKLMADYQEQNNIEYDLVIRTRTDVEIESISHTKITRIIEKRKLQRYISFPSISVRGTNLPVNSPIVSDNLNLLTPYVEYCFFISSGKILNKKLFDNYTEKLSKIIFNVKLKDSGSRLVYRSSHNCVPLFLKQAPYVELGAPIPGFNYKLKQMPKQGDIHGK